MSLDLDALDRKILAELTRNARLPIAELARLWEKYEPEAHAYVIRAVDPEAAVPPPGLKLANA